MPKLYASSVIDAPVESVWQYIRDFNSLPKWFPGVTDSKIEGGRPSDSVGCVRDFGLEGGPRMRERLLALSDATHTCSYSMVDSPMPMSSYAATVRLFPVTDGNRTFAEISAELECGREAEAELTGLLSGAYNGAFEHLKKHVSKA